MSTSNAIRNGAQEADVVPLSVEQYHRMLDQGILEEDAPVELLHGLLVHKDRGGPMPVPVSPKHALVTSRLVGLAAELQERGCHLRIQNPVTLPPNHEPEPDAAIVRGGPESYLENHPKPGDILCVIEVADSSLSTDRGVKQGIYAEAGIRQYVIVNLPERRLEVHEEPDSSSRVYKVVRILQDGESVALNVGEGEPLPVDVGPWLP